MKAIAAYCGRLSQTAGGAWNDFWFDRLDPASMGVLRIFVGLAALWFLLSYSTDLIAWFGPEGVLPPESVRQLSRADVEFHFRLSHLNYVTSPAGIWICHLAALTAALAFTVGIFTRFTSVLTLAAVLSYVHRAPILIGQFEPVLTMSLFYLCIAPAGAFLSLDRFVFRRKADQPADGAPEGSLAANIATKLMQIHVAAIYVMMGLMKLGGECWWTGEAVGWLIYRPETSLIDLSFLHLYAVNAWTHAIVLFELSFPLLVWVRPLRPIVLAVAVVMWTLLAVLTGLVSFCAMMIVVNLVFVPPEFWRSVRAGIFGSPASGEA